MITLKRTGEKLTSIAVSRMCDLLQHDLPEAYCEFILANNGGLPVHPVHYMCGDHRRELLRFLQCTPEDMGRILSDVSEFAPGVVPIAYDSGDSFICIETATGRIVTVSEAGTVFVAADFADFISTLVVDPPDKMKRGHLPALQEAVRQCDYELVDELLANGAPVSGALYICVQGRLPDMAAKLIQAGADVNEEDSRGKRPMYYAVGPKAAAVREVLLRHGAR